MKYIYHDKDVTLQIGRFYKIDGELLQLISFEKKRDLFGKKEYLFFFQNQKLNQYRISLDYLKKIVIYNEDGLEEYKPKLNTNDFSAKEIMKPDFKKEDFFKWRVDNKSTGFINNDMLDSWRYSLSFQSGLGLDNFENYLRDKNEEMFIKQHKLPRKVIFNDKKKATTLLYGNEATVVKTCKGDKYDREKGFLMAFFQKQSGLSKTQAKRYLKSIVEQE